MPVKIYHLEVEAVNCEVNGIINGLPCYNARGIDAPVTISKPINSVLIGKNNQIQLVATPKELTSFVDPEPYTIKARIKLYDDGDVTGPENGKLLKEEVYTNTPVNLLSFDNEYFNFSNRLLLAPRITKEEVLQYAEKLQAILRQQSPAPVIAEFQEKLKDYAFVYGDTVDTMYDGFREYLSNRYFPNKPRLDFSRHDIIAEPYCGERLWQISVGLDREEFLYAGPDPDDMIYTTKVFVGRVNDQLMVVR